VATKLFRWRAIGPLLLLALLLGIGWLVFGDRLVESAGEDAGTDLLGTELDLERLSLRETRPGGNLAGAALTNPLDPTRNLVETGAIELRVDPEALIERKLVIERLSIKALRFDTPRATPGTVSESGAAYQILRSLADWREGLDVPILRLSTIDSVADLVLDPGSLETVRRARGLARTGDSLVAATRALVTGFDPGPAIDSAKALAGRIAATDPKSLNLLQARSLTQSARRTVAAVDSLIGEVEGIERQVGAGVDSLAGAVAALDEARRQDYAFARSLLDLPDLRAPEIGRALFGHVSLDRLQQLLYYSHLAERYLPPGLQPRTLTGPRRLRRAGVTVTYPRSTELPSFLLREGAIELAIPVGGRLHPVALEARGLTSEPSVYGEPATLSARATIAGDRPISVTVSALLDHRTSRLRDSLAAALDGVDLPSLRLPGVPLAVDLGTGSSRLSFSRTGDRVRARWSFSTRTAAWRRVDSAGARGAPALELLWQVVSGLDELAVTAALDGELARPSFSVSTNLDRALAGRLRELVGDVTARAEQRARAAVDSIVGTPVREARAALEAARSEGRERLQGIRGRLGEARAEIDAALRRLAPRLPGDE